MLRLLALNCLPFWASFKEKKTIVGNDNNAGDGKSLKRCNSWHWRDPFTLKPWCTSIYQSSINLTFYWWMISGKKVSFYFVKLSRLRVFFKMRAHSLWIRTSAKPRRCSSWEISFSLRVAVFRVTPNISSHSPALSRNSKTSALVFGFLMKMKVESEMFLHV